MNADEKVELRPLMPQNGPRYPLSPNDQREVILVLIYTFGRLPSVN